MSLNNYILAANFVFWLHFILLLFGVFGGVCAETRLAHVIFLPLVVLHWKTYQDRCVLTDIEIGFRQKAGVDVKKESGAFLRKIFKALGVAPSDKALGRGVYIFIICLWLISFSLLEK